jgi:hypothetical protein
MNEWFEPDPTVVRGLTDRRLSRREFLRYAGIGGLSLGALVAACSTNKRPTRGTGTAPTRELFVDNTIIDTMPGCTQILQTPQPANIAINTIDWDGSSWSSRPIAIKDGSDYRIYYSIGPAPGAEGGPGTGVAFSSDGINWTRPNLGQVLWNVDTNNNIMAQPVTDPTHPMLFAYPQVNTRPGASAADKYVATGGDVTYTAADGSQWDLGLWMFNSSDGLRWNTRIPPGKFLPDQERVTPSGTFIGSWRDGINILFWSDAEQCYVCLERHMIDTNAVGPQGGSLYRWVSRSTSTDLLTWTSEVNMDFGGIAPEEWYFHSTAPYFRAPQIYIGGPSHYVHYDDPDFPNGIDDGHSTRCESRFTVVRPYNPTHYDRTFSTFRWITSGLDNSAFQFPNQSNWPVWAGRLGVGWIPTGPAEMSTFLEQPGRFVRYTLRTDGFVALNAGSSGGTMTTQPLTLSGTGIEVNYEALTGGSLRMAILDETTQGELAGYGTVASPVMNGNEVSRRVVWAGGNATELAGRSVRLRFEVGNANVFSVAY